jgi:hypothetical protein
MQVNSEKISSAPFIFGLYMVAASLCILAFRLFFPGELSPLPVFSRNWGLIQGLLGIIALFPALAFSALVIPFGIAGEEGNKSGSFQIFFQRMTKPLITAISAAVLYALLFFLVLPLAQNYEENLRFRGDIYHLAKERAQAHRQAGEWPEAAQFIGICDSIWPNSPELSTIRTEVEIRLDELRHKGNEWTTGNDPARKLNSASVSALPGQGQPVDAADAIAMGEVAFKEGRLFDAHWLATLGERLARPSSLESAKAAQLAARSWNQIELQQPNSIERNVSSIYRLKLSGYEAMVSGDWIRAYYIFKDLLVQTPNDPDAEKFFAASEKGTREVAFFIDEMEITLGNTLTNTLFSLPGGSAGQGRSVMRVASLSTTPDCAYGTGIEYMVFDFNGNLLLSLQAPYVKFLPITLNDQPKMIVLMRTLDRNDRSKRWEPVWNAENKTVYAPETAQITLDVDYETFLMLSEMRQGIPSMYIDALFAASGIAGEMGYIPEVFEAEFLNRLGACLFFLPMAVFSIVIGWRFRAKYRSRYFLVLSLPVLPLVFNGVTYLYRNIFNNIGISLIYNMNYSTAFGIFIAILVVSFLLSLITLAAQRD